MPYSREEYDLAWQILKSGNVPALDEIERARLMLIRYWQIHGSSARKKAGWKNDVAGREAAYAARYWNKLPSWVMDAANRLKEAQIECLPAVDLIRRFQFWSTQICLICCARDLIGSTGRNWMMLDTRNCSVCCWIILGR